MTSVLLIPSCGDEANRATDIPVTNDSCDGVDCSNHGVCVLVDGGPTCDCSQGYHAESLECLADTDFCQGVTCSGNGNCVTVGGEATCECDTGYHAEGLECREDETAVLYFKSEFDGDIHVAGLGTSQYNGLIGIDSNGYDWETDLPGINRVDGDSTAQTNFCMNRILPAYQDEYLTFMDMRIDDVLGPDGVNNVKALYLEQKVFSEEDLWDGPVGTGTKKFQGTFTAPSVTMALSPRHTPLDGNPLDDEQTLRTLYMQCYMKMHFHNQDKDWRLLSQTKSIGTKFKWSTYAVNMDEPSPEDYYWQLKAERPHYYNDDLSSDYQTWFHSNEDIAVPVDEWFKYEVHVVYGVGEEGYVVFAVNDEVVCEHIGTPEVEGSHQSGGTLWSDGSLNAGFRLYGIYGAKGSQHTSKLELWNKPPSSSVLRGRSPVE